MKRDVRVLGIIPARGGSKRIPRKNIAHVAGKPLLSYAIHAAQKSKMLDAFIVSTDDVEIAAIAKSLDADVPFLRPKKYAQDNSPDIDYAKHALIWVEKHRGWKPEIIVLLPPDVPVRTGKDIDNIVRFLLDNDFDSVRTIAGPIKDPPLKTMWTMENKKHNSITPLFPELLGKPSQQIPEYYYSFGLVYATRTACVKKGTLWGPRIGGYVIDPKRFIEIDHKDQLRQATTLLQKKKK
jgi:CMP-N-acetylneuraminic acid synthetase